MITHKQILFVPFSILVIASIACNAPFLIEDLPLPTLAPTATSLPSTPTQFVISSTRGTLTNPPPTTTAVRPSSTSATSAASSSTITASLIPSSTATNSPTTPPPPTITSVVPTATRVPPSATQIPATAIQSTATKTNTTVPASATQIPPTATQATATKTNTAVPPTTAPTATKTNTTVPPSATQASTGCATLNAGFENTVIALVNAERAKVGLGQLAAQSQLMAAARAHSSDMACKNFFSHTGSDGSSPFDRMARFGYSFSTAAENIYAGSGPYNSPQAALDGWMNSQGHRDNILNPDFTQIGSGYAFNSSSQYGGYFTNTFGRP